MEYTERVTFGLVKDVLEVLAAHGIVMADGDPARYAHALSATCDLADAVAGPGKQRRPVAEV